MRRVALGYPDATTEPLWEPPARFADGTVRGWRSWLVGISRVHGPRLVSYNGFPRESWPRVIEARCLLECDTLLSPDCSCVVYAVTDFDFCWAEFEEIVAQPRPGGKFKDFLVPKAVGEVCGWGRVNLHEHGWRSERAMVRRLWTAAMTPEHNAALGRFYGVTVRDFEELFREQGMVTP